MSECIEWDSYKNREGYGNTTRDGRKHYAHRLAYCDARGMGIDEIKGLVVRHKCDNPGCVNPKHLLLGSHADNVRDRMERGRHKAHDISGEKHPCAKLSAEQVKEIRRRYKPRCPVNGGKALAAEFGISKHQAWKIVSGKKWSHF